jgi:CheY-like chemotaxis protein
MAGSVLANSRAMRAKTVTASGVPPTAAHAVRLSSGPVDGATTRRILVADSNPESRAIREAQLSAAGFQVLVARTAFEAIVKASCQVPDIILLDRSLGNADIDTSEVNRLLTTCPVTSHIPVVGLTSGRRVPQRILSELRRHGVA